MQQLIFTNNVAGELKRLIDAAAPDRLFFLADTNTRPIAEELAPAGAEIITIGPGDDNKNLRSLSHVWERLSLGGATRHTLLVNIGGGMVTDLGGFAAACFKRGIRFVNVATTLLGAVDAAVGGKTGINFLDLKNELGAFREADAVIISTRYFSTLPPEELLSGFAEMVKHGLISGSETYRRLIDFDIAAANPDELLSLLQESVEVKRDIVSQDPCEQGIRRALNLGHTAGHAFESLALERESPVAHGFAVAHGLLVEMILSNMVLGFPSDELYRYAAWLRENYPSPPVIGCADYPRLLALMSHDKKNRSRDEINFTLLRSPGVPEIDHTAGGETIKSALDIYRDLLGM